jgi:hypothetical protein
MKRGIDTDLSRRDCRGGRKSKFLSIREMPTSTVFYAVIVCIAIIVQPSFPIADNTAFSMFGFSLDLKTSALRSLAQAKGMSPIKETPHHLLFSGPFDQNPETTIWLMAAFNKNQLYEIKIDLESKDKEALAPYAQAGRELAQKTSLPAVRGSIFEGFHFHAGEIFLKDDLFISVGLYDTYNDRWVVSFIYRKQSDFLRYEIEKDYRFEGGRRDPGRITAAGLPDSIDGQKVYWPRDDKRIIPPKLGQLKLNAHKTQGYLYMIVIIDSQGRIRKGYIRHSSSPAMTAAVRAAIPRVQCEPGMLEGQPVPTYAIIIVNSRSQ